MKIKSVDWKITLPLVNSINSYYFYSYFLLKLNYKVKIKNEG